MSSTWYFLKINGKVAEVIFADTEQNDSTWKKIPSEHFLSVKEIAEHQLQQMTCEQLLSMSKMKKEELIGLHFSYGMWLRNSYGLWHPNNPFPVKNDLGDGHPDGLSMLVIEEIHKRLTTVATTESDAFQDAMSIVQEK